MKSSNIHSPDIENWLKLRYADGVGPKTFIKLIEYFGSVERVLGSSISSLKKINGIGDKTAEQILRSSESFDSTKEIHLADKNGVTIINLEDDRYPAGLRKICDPPPVLYVKGNLVRQDSLAISVVGSRRCSLYGQEQASRFSHILANAGFTVVSGMARGIDTAAHRGALSAKGRTIAVQGCGLCNIFPPENKQLFAEIAQNGACLSEFPMQYEPLAENFPTRNRIIAGISMAVIVIEASQKSGSLITARLAMEYNREVMAIPGKIDSPLNTGSHNLIKQGAKLIDCAEDIMEALGYIGQGLKNEVFNSQKDSENRMERALPRVSQLNLSANETKIYGLLGSDGSHIEDVISRAELEAGQINAALISLRLKGLIRQMPGNLFAKL